MIFQRASFFCAVFFTMTAQCWAAPLTLQECMRKASDNNPILKRAAWDTSLAQENVRLAGSTSYPRIDAMAGYTMQLDPQAVIINGRIAETQEPDFAFAGISANYTLYDFGRRDARKRQAGAAANAAAQNFESKRSDVALQTIEAWFGILETGKLITAADDEVIQVSEHRRVAQVLFEEGVVTRNDVLQADVRLAAARQKLLALKNRRENGWLLLNFLTGSEAGFRAELDETSALAIDQASDKDLASIISKRHDIQALQHGAEASEHEVIESRGSFFPELYTRLALDYVQNDKVREQNIMAATLGVKFNLFDGYASTATREKAIKNRSQIQDSLRLAREQARLEIDSAKNDAAVAKERIAVAEAAIRQSEENLRINQERYRERVGTATEVLDAQTLVTQTKTDYQRAYYDCQTAMARLKHASGEL